MPVPKKKPASLVAKWNFQEQFTTAAVTGTRVSSASPGGFKYMTQGGAEPTAATERQQTINRKALVKGKIWDTAISPVKSLGFNFAMCAVNKYFAGTSSGIMGLSPLIFSGSMLVTAIKLLFSVQSAFARFQGNPDTPIFMYKALYVFLCAVASVYMAYELVAMGLIPVHSGDYVSYIPEKKIIETSVGFLT